MAEPDYSSGPTLLPCAVSGGADSLALLVLAVEAGLLPVAYHVDHGLREGSRSEVDVVVAAAEILGSHGPSSGKLEVVSLRVDLSPGPNLEARARSARFSVLPVGVATGHTADDQAETVLINLLRGASTAGLAGMAPGTRHPILGVRRSETRAICREAGLDWLEDPSNAELGPLRNRIRHQLLPSMNEASGRDLVPILCRQSELLGDDEALLDELSRSIDPTVARHLAEAARPLARRAVRRWLRDAAGSPYPPSAATVERVLGVASGRVLACEVGGGLTVRRRRGRLVLTATS
ncbi:MAG: tRNA lysidine(34) synthetase TilS [Acidimicrobiales bacterium]